jgi:hypothetical protein
MGAADYTAELAELQELQELQELMEPILQEEPHLENSQLLQ